MQGRGHGPVLLGQASLAKAVQPALADQDQLWVLASGPPPPNPSELLASPVSREVLRALALEFDIVLVDSPPVLPVTDAAVLAGHADASLVVAVAGSTTGRGLARAVEVLRQVNAGVVGTVLQRSRRRGRVRLLASLRGLRALRRLLGGRRTGARLAAVQAFSRATASM
jgi:Mrp family chromosome partitioning ATPase